MVAIYFRNKNENRLEEALICENETDLNFTMIMEHVVAFTKSTVKPQ